MFERFTDKARHVVILAQEEAVRLRHSYIGTEHLLVGLVQEADGLAAEVLMSLDISLMAVRERVEALIGTGELQHAASGHIPFTPRIKKVLELSLREALQMGSADIDTEHILLGLLHEGEGVAAQVLGALGADLTGVRQRVIQLRQSAEAGPAERAISGRWSRTRYGEQGAASLTALSRRTAALERWAGLNPDLGGLDDQIAKLGRDKESAITRRDFQEAAGLREKEHELRAERKAKMQDTVAGPTLADMVRQLRDEVARLRSVLREHGINPGDAA
jgi:ATP-dependent Clp protease ATP-binding subunit ClpC